VFLIFKRIAGDGLLTPDERVRAATPIVLSPRAVHRRTTVHITRQLDGRPSASPANWTNDRSHHPPTGRTTVRITCQLDGRPSASPANWTDDRPHHPLTGRTTVHITRQLDGRASASPANSNQHNTAAPDPAGCSVLV
jgi:hypothetical protein